MSEPGPAVSNLAISNSIIERPINGHHVSEVLCTDSSLHREVVVSRAKALWASPPKSLLRRAAGLMDGSDRSLAFLSRQLQQIKQGCLREARARSCVGISKTKSSRLWGQPFENILDMLEAAITGSPSEAH